MIVPRQLLIEILSSLQDLIFYRNRKAREQPQAIIDILISEQQLDPGINNDLDIDGLPDDFHYQYLAERLRRLTEVLSKPLPSEDILGAWAEWNESDSIKFKIAIAALVISAISSSLSAIIGIIQLGISIHNLQNSAK